MNLSAVQPSVRHIIRNVFECGAVDNFQVTPVPALYDAPRGEAVKRPTDGFKRHSHVFADVGPAHREVYLGRAFPSGGLKLFEQLKEHRDPGKSLPLRKEKRVTLRLTEFLAELADDMKFQAGIFR